MKIDREPIIEAQNITGLSRKEALFLSSLAEQKRTIFRFADALKFWTEPSAARSTLSRLHNGGWVKRIERGLYMVIPLDAGPARAWAESSLVVASYLIPEGAVAYWSALHYWHLTEQWARTVFIQSSQRKSKADLLLDAVHYQFVTIKPERFFGFVSMPVDHHTVRITDREKTIIDAADRPDLSGGIAQLAIVLGRHWQELDWRLLDEYLRRFNSGAVVKRLGYLIEKLALPLPDLPTRLQGWQALLSAGITLLEPGSNNPGPIDRRWRICDNREPLVGKGQEMS